MDNNEAKKIDRLLKKLVKDSGDKQAKYWYGVEFSDHTKPDYRARVLFSKRIDGALFASDNVEDLAKRIKDYIKKRSTIDANIAYFEAQILLDEASIETHKLAIEEYKKKRDE